MRTQLGPGEELIQQATASAKVSTWSRRTPLTHTGDLYLTNMKLFLEETPPSPEAPAYVWTLPLTSVKKASSKGIFNKKLVVEGEFSLMAEIKVPNPKGWETAITSAIKPGT